MGYFLDVFDQLAGLKKLRRPQIRLIHPKVTIAQIIETRVRNEVALYNESEANLLHGLVQPSAEASTGDKIETFQKISADMQVARALNAFERHRFFMFLNGKQVESLQTLVSVETPAEVVFVKLFPLAGG